MHAYLNKAMTAFKNAGKLLLRTYDSLESHPEKLDLQIQKMRQKIEATLYTELKDIYPRHEFAFPTLDYDTNSDLVWFIQILSGEENFRHGIPTFAMALSIHNKGKVEYALIYDPILQEMFSATKGGHVQLGRTRVRVSKQTDFNLALLGTNIALPHARIRQTGCAALDLAYVAAGRLDGFVGQEISNFELAAGALLIQVAGGLYGDFSGGNNYQEKGEIIASQPKLFKNLLTLTPSFTK